MLLKIALVLMAAWLLGVLGLYDIGDAVHLLFLVGGMLLLLGVVKGRDAALTAERRREEPSRRG
jgi:hypothetical protein